MSTKKPPFASFDSSLYFSHSKGEWAGQPFILAAWQQFILWCVFGWMKKDDEGNSTRRFRSVYCEVCRKTGETSLAAGVGLYMLLADGEAGAEVYTAATKRDQARLGHGEAVSMVKASKYLKQRVSLSKDNLYVEASNSRYVALGGDADSTDGLSPSCCIIDELHAHRTRAMFDVLDTATGARKQPLLFVITTAGHDRNSICWEQHAYSQRILESGTVQQDNGNQEVTSDDAHFAFIAAIDEGDDSRDQACWQKANPNLQVSLKLEDLQRKAREPKKCPRH